MSRSIDQRIVEMRFDNREFEAKSKESIKTLETLKKSLELENATKSLHDLSAAGKSFSLAGIADGVGSIASKFTALDVVAFTVLQNLTNAAINFGKKLTGIVLDPLVQGGKRRALNIEQAKFQFEGLGMDIEATMQSALAAVDGTAYGLDEAAKVASQLGASGMRAGDKMTASLRAVAGVAAMTNSSYEDMGNIFTTVAGNGRLMGQQLLQLSGRGINAAAAIAKHMGTTEEVVRDMVSKGKISFKDFTEAMDASFGEHAKSANKLFSGAASNLRAAFARIGADLWTPALRNLRDVFNALRPVINTLHKALKPLITAITEVMAVVTKRWVKTFENMDISPLSDAFQSLINVFTAMYRVMKPITDAFRQIFPPYTTEQLMAFTKGLKDLTERFKMGEESSDKLRRTFVGLFAVLDIIRMVVITLGKALFSVFKLFVPVTGGILSVTSSLGDFAVAMRDIIKSSDVLNGLLALFKKVLTPVANIVTGFVDIVITSFNSLSKADTSGFDSFLETVRSGFRPFTVIGNVIGTMFGLMLKGIEALWPVFAKLATIGTNAFKKLQDAAGNLVKSLDFGEILGSFLTAGIGLFVFNMSNVLDLFSSWLSITRKPIFEFNKMMFDVKTTFVTWQAQLKADILMKIAKSIALLAAGLWVLSQIDPGRLAGALTAMTGLFVQLFGSLAVYEAVAGKTGSVKLFVLGNIINSVAAAILILSFALANVAKIEPDRLASALKALTSIFTLMTISAVVLSKSSGKLIKGSGGILAFAFAINILGDALIKLSSLDDDQLTRGLIGVAVLTATLALFLKTANFKGLGAAKAAGLILLGHAVNILAKAVKSFGELSVSQLVKGLGAMAIVLAQLAIFIQFTGGAKKVIVTSAGLVILAHAMNILADVLNKLGAMSIKEIVKGLGAMTGVLIAITAAMLLLPKNMISSSIGLLIVAGALSSLAKTLQVLGGMSVKEIVKSLIVLSGALTIITVAMTFMTTAIPGALALFVVAEALSILAGVLKTLGNLSLIEIGVGLLALSSIFGVLFVSGMMLAPVVPILLGLTVILLGLAAASVLFGIASIAVGIGLTAFATGLTALSIAGVAHTSALVLLVSSLLNLIPLFFVKVAEGILAFVVAFKDTIVILVDALVEIGIAIIDGLVTLIPPLLVAAGTLITSLLTFLVAKIPELTVAGMLIILGFLEGIADSIADVTRAGIDIILEFVRGINSRLGAVIDEAFKTIISFINGLAEAIRNNREELKKAGWNLVKAIFEGILDTFKDIKSMGKDIVTNLIDGVKGMASNLAKEGLAIGRNLINSMTSGITSVANNLATTARNAAKRAVDGIKNFLGIRSPSRVFGEMGVDSIQGMINGITSMGKNLSASTINAGKSAMDAMRDAVADMGDLISSDIDDQPVITPLFDLDKIKKGAKEIGDLIKPPTLTPAFASGSAGMISSRTNRAEIIKTQKELSNDVGATTYNVSLDGVYYIREEADIKKLSQELALEIERQRRA